MAEPVRTGQLLSPSIWRRFFQSRLSCVIVLIAALSALAASSFAEIYILFDILSHFAEHFLAIAIGFGLAAIMPDRRWLAAALLTLAGLIAFSIWPVMMSRMGGDAAGLADDETGLKLMTFNTWFRNNDLGAIEREIRVHDADIVLLLEFGAKKRPLLAAIKQIYPYSADCSHQLHCHIAILSKYPITDWKARSPWAGPPYLRAQFGKELDGLTVIGIHSIRPPRIPSQFKQMQALGRLAQRFPEPRIVMGDFNSTPYSRVQREFITRSEMQRLTHKRSWPAFTGWLPQFAIDHIFVTQQFRALAPAKLGNPSGSDHFPVIVPLGFRKKQ